MDLSSFRPTEIVELPAIVKAGMLQMLSPDLLKVGDDMLKEMARLMGGEVVYVKMRAIYEAPETDLCVHKECFRPVDKSRDQRDFCTDHKSRR